MNDITSVANQLNKLGAVGIIPSDTVYGLVARASDQSAVQRLYSVKHREGNPGTIIAANNQQLEELGLKHRYLTAVEQYWPGPISIIIPCADPKLAYLHQGYMSLAVRLPDNDELQQLLQATGPLLTTSANQPKEPVATTIEQAKHYFGETVDFYEDGGDLSGNQASTIIRIVDDAIEVIRQGAVTINEERY